MKGLWARTGVSRDTRLKGEAICFFWMDSERVLAKVCTG
jgi:hypothetical protein